VSAGYTHADVRRGTVKIDGTRSCPMDLQGVLPRKAAGRIVRRVRTTDPDDR
jgi:hypothetical protein